MKTETKDKKVEAEQFELPIDYSSCAGAGYENMTAEDLKIPFLTILQGLSPQIQKKDPEYIEGAEVGMVLETVSKRIFNVEKKPLIVIPCGFKKAFVEWRPRNLGGGFVKAHETAEILKQTKKGEGKEKTKDFLSNGNIIETTNYHSVILITEDGAQPCLIAMKATQLKHSRTWMTLMNSLKMKRSDGSTFIPPMYAYHWKLDTIPESNDLGTYYSWRFTIGELVKSVEVFEDSKKLSTTVARGQLALSAPPDESATEAETEVM